MEMTTTINSLPLPDELCWKVQSYLSSTSADAIKEFNEEIDKSDFEYYNTAQYSIYGATYKNWTGGFFRCNDTLWSKRIKVIKQKYTTFCMFQEDKKKSALAINKFKYSYRNKLYGKIVLIPDYMIDNATHPVEQSMVYKAWYDKINIKVLRQLCKDNNIKVKGRTKQDVYKALLSI